MGEPKAKIRLSSVKKREARRLPQSFAFSWVCKPYIPFLSK